MTAIATARPLRVAVPTGDFVPLAFKKLREQGSGRTGPQDEDAHLQGNLPQECCGAEPGSGVSVQLLSGILRPMG